MKKVLQCIICMVLLSLATELFAANSAATTTVTPKAPANGVLSSTQSIYTLHLKSNPTTGYSWFLVSYPQQSLNLIKHVYLPPSSKLIGAGGYEIWQFKANTSAFIAPQVMKIELMYARPWEINDKTPIQTFYVVTKA